MMESLISTKEGYTVKIFIVFVFPVNVIEEETLDSVIELVPPKVPSDISKHIMWPVCMLYTIQCSVVLNNPQPVLQSLEVQFRISSIS